MWQQNTLLEQRLIPGSFSNSSFGLTDILATSSPPPRMLLAVLGEVGVGDLVIGVGGDHGNHLPRRRRLQNLIVGIFVGQNVNGASSLLTDSDDTAGGLLGGLGIRWDRSTLEYSSESLPVISSEIETMENVLALKELVTRSEAELCEHYTERRMLSICCKTEVLLGCNKCRIMLLRL